MGEITKNNGSNFKKGIMYCLYTLYYITLNFFLLFLCVLEFAHFVVMPVLMQLRGLIFEYVVANMLGYSAFFTTCCYSVCAVSEISH